MNQSAAYGWLTLAGIALSILYWWRVSKGNNRLFYVYLGALGGAFLGAKLIYLAAEGWLRWHDQNRWIELATGKSVLGGLLGGYIGVEIAKSLIGYNEATGDRFAIIVPIGIALGRFGCWSYGCCRGVPWAESWYTLIDPKGVSRWPSVPVEILFNLVALSGIAYLRHRRLLTGQHFHLYLIAYGLFRFFHEFLRDEPRVLGSFSGYQAAALAITALGIWRFVERRHQSAPAVS